MKRKLVAILLSLSLCIVFFGCNNDTENAGDVSSDNGGHESINHANTVSIGGSRRPLLTIDSYVEYKKFIKSGKIPSNFVFYDDIGEFGEFDHFVDISDTLKGEYCEHYMYSLVTSNGYEFSLYVDSSKDARDSYNSRSKNAIDTVNTTDMMTIAEKQTGVYTKSGIDYSYISGQLFNIKWWKGDSLYILSFDKDLINYSFDANTVLGKMFNIETAAEIVNSELYKK